MATETCSVVDQFCDSPANLEPKVPVRGKCFSCGLPVCRQCSTRRQYLSYGRVRLCNTCQEMTDGNDKLIMRRLHAMAGMPFTGIKEATNGE